MRALILTPLYPPLVGGAAGNYSILAPILAEEISVTVLTEWVKGCPLEERQDNLRILRVLPPHAGRPGRSLPSRALTLGLTYLALLFWLPYLKADIVHFHAGYRGPLMRLALSLSRSLVVADVRDQLCYPEQHAPYSDQVLCGSENLQQYLENFGISSQLMPQPLPPLEVEREPSQPFVLFVGDLAPHKGIPELLDAYPHWADPREVPLVLVGPNFLGSLPDWVDHRMKSTS